MLPRITLLVASCAFASIINAQESKSAYVEDYVAKFGSLPVNASDIRTRQSNLKSANTPNAFGTIQYDSGTGGVSLGTDSFSLGNLFDTAANTGQTACCWPVESTASLSVVEFSLLSITGTAAWVSIIESVTGTSGSAVSSANQTGLASGLNTVAPGLTGVNADFFVGVWFSGGNDPIAFDAGTTLGQGFHGAEINDVAATGFTSFASNNAVMRVTGDVPTPVELLQFSVDD